AILLLVSIPAMIKIFRPSYFANLYTVLRNPGIKYEKIRGALYNSYLSAILLDLYFCISFGYYVYYLLRYFNANILLSRFSEWFQLLIWIGVFAVIYAIKYFSIKFLGWILQIEERADGYNYNILFFNKVSSFLLIPFTVVITF